MGTRKRRRGCLVATFHAHPPPIARTRPSSGPRYHPWCPPSRRQRTRRLRLLQRARYRARFTQQLARRLVRDASPAAKRLIAVQTLGAVKVTTAQTGRHAGNALLTPIAIAVFVVGAAGRGREHWCPGRALSCSRIQDVRGISGTSLALRTCSPRRSNHWPSWGRTGYRWTRASMPCSQRHSCTSRCRVRAAAHRR